MMRKVKLLFLAVQIEYLWGRIVRNRKRMQKLLEQRTPYTAPALLRLDGKTREMGWRARALESAWRAIAGV